MHVQNQVNIFLSNSDDYECNYIEFYAVDIDQANS